MSRLGLLLTAAAIICAATAQGDSAPESAWLRITKADCARLVKHEPAPGVGHEPGIDVRGNAVAPADLNGARPVETPDHFVIPIEIDLAQRLGVPRDPARFDADLLVGLVAVEGGRVLFNEQVLHDDVQAALADACRRRRDASR